MVYYVLFARCLKIESPLGHRPNPHRTGHVLLHNLCVPHVSGYYLGTCLTCPSTDPSDLYPTVGFVEWLTCRPGRTHVLHLRPMPTQLDRQ